jgi:hypothetical protein
MIRDNFRPGNTLKNSRELNLFRPKVTSGAPLRNDVQPPLVPAHSEPFRDSRAVFQNNNNPTGVGRPDNRSTMTERITGPSKDSRPVVQNIQNFNSSSPERPDFRPALSQRRNEVVNNDQVVNAKADHRTNSLNNANNNFEPVRRQNFSNTQPAVNNPRSVIEASGFRSGQGAAFNRNAYSQGNAAQPRSAVKQQTRARPLPQVSSNRPFANR